MATAEATGLAGQCGRGRIRQSGYFYRCTAITERIVSVDVCILIYMFVIYTNNLNAEYQYRSSVG